MFSFMRQARESLTPILKESHFQSNGMMTPEEFVKSGDLLVRFSFFANCFAHSLTHSPTKLKVSKCRTWRWCSGDTARIRTYLPSDKQFLLIQGCLSTKRVKDMKNSGNKIVDNNDEIVDDGWMVVLCRSLTHLFNSSLIHSFRPLQR
jgi:ubiquitin-like-conjugating enzyme ATG3